LAEEIAIHSVRSQMQADVVLRALTPRTWQYDINAVKGLSAHYHKRTDALSQHEMQCHLLHLIEC
jgi:hypothetical protein